MVVVWQLEMILYYRVMWFEVLGWREWVFVLLLVTMVRIDEGCENCRDCQW